MKMPPPPNACRVSPGNSVSRRSVLKAGAGLGVGLGVSLAGAGALGFPAVVRGASGCKLRIALVGVHGRGAAHHPWASEESVVALCDADAATFTRKTAKHKGGNGLPANEQFPDAAMYQDYRELYDRADDFDAVVISTPDHAHYVAAAAALKLGKAVYCEKPLTWSTAESLELMRLTRDLQVPTQLGNQGMADPGWRQAYSYYHAGLIGQVHTVQAWTPLQGQAEGLWGVAGGPRPEGEDPVPEGLDWASWMGPAPARPYVSGAYHPRKWRQFVDFGTGFLGDWCCHKLAAVFKILNPAMPTAVWNQDVVDWNRETWPLSRQIHWEFAAGETTRVGQSEPLPRDAFRMVWHDGAARPTAADLPHWDPARTVPKHGVAMIGDKGTIVLSGGHAEKAYLLPRALHAEHRHTPLAPELPGRDHFTEFVRAAKGELAWDAPVANFVEGGHLTAVSLLGNASLLADQKLMLDAAGQITNVDDPARVMAQGRPESV